jgi:pimeloyl-ACP methyl ester carboxylesterase
VAAETGGRPFSLLRLNYAEAGEGDMAMTSAPTGSKSPNLPIPGLFGAATEYATDAAQRWVLFLDVLRQRGNAYREHAAETAPNVLEFKCELVVDGRKLDRPVNYGLVRIVPPAGVEIHQTARPFVIVDPRAGHGPGIGGFKADSEIGMAMRAGHPCYFVGFLPEPMPGQTIEDIARAEAVFLDEVIKRHPQADGKPCVIGNCQAGWAVMMLAAIRPELFGPIIIAGSPLSYWDGVRGQYPMRYSGGLLGGSWLTALTSDLGAGKFDGAWLVQNFESQNPANTYWTKQYNLYSKVDTEAERYLGFERWWGGHVNLNAEEIQFIVDELFVGNNLTAGRIKTSNGTAIDLRSIRSPIVVFCSKGDNITPPPQALGWILDLYDDVDQIRSYGQTIVYTIHDDIGHLGIFVSSGVARKQYSEFSDNIDLIDTLPPGLYEATFTKRSDKDTTHEHASGDWVMRCEARTLDDIRALGGNDAEDERRFATAARISETNLALYRTYMQPFVRAFANPMMAEWMRNMHPLRLQYEMFSDANPFMTSIKETAEKIREGRKPVSSSNPFLAMQENVSRHIVQSLDHWREATEKMAERTFLAVYGSPALQAACGIEQNNQERSLRKAASSPLHRQLVESRIAEIRSHIGQGGLREAMVRAALHIGMARQYVDERGFELIRKIRLATTENQRLTLTQFKAMVREQFFMLLIDQEGALAAIPALLPPGAEERQAALAAIRDVISASGELSGEAAERMKRVTSLFEGGKPRLATAANL